MLCSHFPKFRMKQTRLHSHRLCEFRKLSVFRCSSFFLFLIAVLGTVGIPDNFGDSIVLYSQVQTAPSIYWHLSRKVTIIHDFDNAVAWSKPNKVKDHFAKTTCMLVGTRQRIRMSCKLNIHLENTCIKNVSEQKLLGVFIDKKPNLVFSYRPPVLTHLF